MSLPWFSFNIKDFLANTQRLDTEATGAYLLLLLDYYQHEQGAPDVAKTLATVTHLSLERWLEHAPVVLPLFEIRDGRLWHERCEEEIAKGRKLYVQRLAAGEASVAARAAKREAKRSGERAVEREVNGRPSQKGSEIASRQRDDNEPLSWPDNEPLKSLREILRVPNEPLNEPATQEQEQRVEVGTNVPTSALGMDAPLDPDFKLTAEDVIRCQNDGANSAQIAAIFDGWKAYNLAAGTFSNDWPGSWWRRWERDKPVQPKPTRPRIEVSNRKAKGKELPWDWQPNDKHKTMCQERGIDVEELEETFRDYCAQAANRTRYSDHDAAFRTFIKNQQTFTRRGPPHGQAASRRAPPPSRGSIVGAADEAIATLDRAIEAAESRDGVREAAVQPVPGQRLRQPEGGAGGDGDGAE